jgi:hypothetical protein
MSRDCEEPGREVVAGATCPMFDCGALVLAYRPARMGCASALPWEFSCPRCGLDFAAFEDGLIFQSVPKDWFCAGVTLK